MTNDLRVLPTFRDLDRLIAPERDDRELTADDLGLRPIVAVLELEDEK